MSSSIRWGICTAGNIAHDFSTSLLGHEDHHILAAVAARTLGSAQQFAKEFNIPKAYGSYEELARDSNIDVVYIGSVNTEHKNLCLLYINCKKHVLCEKPLAMNLGEVEAIVDAARKQKVFLMEAIWTRFFPGWSKICEIISSGQLGKIKVFLANMGCALGGVERIYKKDLGGGATYHLGVYLVQFATMVFGGQVPSSSTTHGYLNDDGVDETYTTTMLFPSNGLATITCSFDNKFQNDAHIIGEMGRIRIPNHFWAPTTLEVIDQDGVKDVLEFNLPSTVPGANFRFSPEMAGLYYEAEAVRQAISEGKTEHALLRWNDIQLITSLMDKIRHDLGYYWKGDPTP